MAALPLNLAIKLSLVWLLWSTATNSNFPAYSSQLKTSLTLSQSQLNHLTFASDCGKFFAFLSGLALAHLPIRLVLIISVLLSCVGYIPQYLFVAKLVDSPPYWMLFMLNMVAGNSVCWFTTVCYVVIFEQFGSSRDVAVGVLTSFQGLSAKIYADIVGASHIVEYDRVYLMLNALVPAAVSLLVLPVLKLAEQGTGEFHFWDLFWVNVLVGVFAVISSFNENVPNPLLKVCLMAALLLGPLVTGLARRVIKFSLARSGNPNPSEDAHVINVPVLNETLVFSDDVLEEEYVKPTSMLRQADFWLYFGVYLCGPTLGFVFLNYLGQIAESRRFPKISVLVSLAACSNFFGRLAPSLLYYLPFFKRMVWVESRPILVAILMIPMSTAFALLVIKSSYLLIFSTIVISACTGGITTISVSMTRILFGTKKFGINHNIVTINIPLGSCVFSLLASDIYHDNSVRGKCVGQDCFEVTFVFWAVLCLVGSGLAWILHVRTRKS